jgi:amino acid adenylation domain-containing protein
MNDNLIEYLEKILQKNISLTAIVDKQSSITYKQLLENIYRIKDLLIDNHTSSYIGVYAEKSIRVYPSLLGVIFANKAYIPINPLLNLEKISSILNDTKINVLITTKDKRDFIKNQLSEIEILIYLEDFSIEILKDTSTNTSQYCEDAYILFTSGSTGSPKGVRISKDNVLEYIKTKKELYNFQSGLRFSQTAQLNFDISTFEIYICFSTLGTLYLTDDKDILFPFDYIINNKINVWYSVPTFAIILNRFNMLTPDIFPHLQYTFFCGEPLPYEIAIKWSYSAQNSIVENLYGPTEATVDISRFVVSKKEDINQEFYNGNTPIGLAIKNQKVVLVDENNRLITSKNDVGEILISGTQVGFGYLNNPIKNQETYCYFDFDNYENRWYKSGDLAFYNSDMQLEFHSRKDTQIKLNGKRVEIGELEYLFRNKTVLNEIVIVAQYDDNNRVDKLIGFILKNLSSNEIVNIKQTMEQYTDKVFIPKKFVYIEEFPKTLSGKVDRKALYQYL